MCGANAQGIWNIVNKENDTKYIGRLPKNSDNGPRNKGPIPTPPTKSDNPKIATICEICISAVIWR